MFLSKPPGRKQINLGGQNRAREEDRTRFLQRTEQERQLRLLEKKRNASATKIQAWFRAKRALRKQAEEERRDWDQKMSKLQLLPLPIASAVPIFFPLLRQFLFFYNAELDVQRFYRVCQLVLSSTKNKEPANYFCPALRQDTRLGWLVQTKRFSRVCAQHLIDESADLQSPSVSLRMLLSLCNAAEWPLGSDDEKSVLTSRLLLDLVNNNLFEKVHRALVRVIENCPLHPKDAKDAHPVLLGLVSLALLPFHNIAFLASSSKAAQDFTVHILAVPSLVRRLPASLTQSLVCSFPSSLVVSASSFDPKSTSSARTILDNLLDLVAAAVQQHNVQISTAFLEAVSRLLDHFTSAFQASNKPKRPVYLDQDDMELEEEEVEAEVEDHPHRENLVLQQVSGLISPSTLLALFKVFLPSELPVPSSSKDFAPFRVVFPRGLISLCQLCHTLLASEHPMRLPVLNALSHTVVANIWRLLMTTIEFHEFVEKGSTGPMNEVSGVLGLFCICYSHLLVTMDDEEFFNRQTCFTLKEVEIMSLALKKVVFRMYWVKGERDVPAVYQNRNLRKAITAVLQQLYDRNSRHVYCSDHHWAADEIALNTAQFEVDVISKNERALRILKHIPFLVPADMRFQLFNTLIMADKEEVAQYRSWGGETRVTIRREFVFEDGYSSLAALPPERLKGVVKVSFVNSEGLPEAGIDGGGVFKEFLTELSKKAFGPEYGLFLETPDRLLYPNPFSHRASENHLKHFEFLGRVIGKAMYEGIQYADPLIFVEWNHFRAKLLSKFNYYNDLVFLDPELHRNMMILKHYTGNVEEDFALNFTVTNNEFGAVEVKELVPGGRDIPVTNENRVEYIHRIAHYRLNTQIRRQCAAFLRGYTDIIKPEWLRMFNQHELHLLIAGRQGGIDLVDLRQHVQYGGGYSDDHPAIVMFWEVLQTFSVEDQHLFLKFVTSCSRPPLLGFAHLNPRFAIHKAGGSDRSAEHLPTASTCMNLLKLFPYRNATIMREKLLYAIRSSAGFELS